MDKWIEFIISILPAITGGIVRYLHDITRKGQMLKWDIFFLQLFIASVVGWWTLAITSDMSYFVNNENMQGAVVGVSSFLSPNILDLILKYFPLFAEKRLKGLKK